MEQNHRPKIHQLSDPDQALRLQGMNRPNPLRYQNCLGFNNLEYPHDGMLVYGLTLGDHRLEIEYQQGFFYVTDRHKDTLDLYSECECRSPQRAYTILMRKAVQLGFY